MPIFSRIVFISTESSVISVPSNNICPSVVLSRRFKERRNVDLPHPDGPIMATTSPFLIAF